MSGPEDNPLDDEPIDREEYERYMKTKQITQYEHECKRCAHKWVSLLEKPVRCPRCISPYWDKPRKERP